MNIGFYLNGTRDIDAISEEVSRGLKDKAITDASIFMDSSMQMPSKPPCAVYNSCDLWSFHGKLITTDFTLVEKARNIVNDIDMYYYFGFERPNVLAIVTAEDLKFIANGEKAAKEFKRITNREPDIVSESYNNIIGELNE
jgi:hypothetical protein